MVMRVPAFPRPARPPRPMFRGVMPPPPPPPPPPGGPYGQFPPGPPCFSPGGRPPMPPGGPGAFRGADHMRPMRPPLRVFGPPPPPPPPPHFMRGPGAMRSRPLFRPPKFSPYPVGVKVKKEPLSPSKTNAANSTTNITQKSDSDGTNSTPVNDGTSQTTATANGTVTTSSATASVKVEATAATTTNANSGSSAKNGLAAAIEAAKRDGIPVEMIQALYCKLCDAKLNGSLQATAHYVGKSHAKRVKQYQQGQGRVGQQRLNAAAAAGGDASKGAATDGGKRPVPDTLEKFCKLCDVAFTSEIQAKQHYDGRNHQRRMRGEPPLPKGFYNPATGRWQRQPPPGMALKPPTPRKPPTPGNQFYCEPCRSSLTSEQQLQSHLQGAKHKARVGGLSTAVTAQVVTANAAAAMATATVAGTVSTAGGRPSQLPQPYVAFVPGPTMTCGTEFCYVRPYKVQGKRFMGPARSVGHRSLGNWSDCRFSTSSPRHSTSRVFLGSWCLCPYCYKYYSRITTRQLGCVMCLQQQNPRPYTHSHLDTHWR
nr:zinc finger protein 385D-like isoform X1 [Dermacentor andersoni]